MIRQEFFIFVSSMKSKKQILSLFFSVCVILTFMLQSVHSYSHLVSDYFSTNAQQINKDKLVKHHPDDCQICHFTFSPFTTVTHNVIVFYNFISYPKLNVLHHINYIDASFDFISLRGPPVFV